MSYQNMTYAEQLTRDYAAIRARLYGIRRVNIADEIIPYRRAARETKSNWRRIVYEVCKQRGVEYEIVLGKNMKPKYCEARFECWFRIHEETTYSYPQIGKFFGRDHTTILHGAARWREISGV